MTDMDYSKTGIFDRHNSDLTKQKNKELYAMYEAYYEKIQQKKTLGFEPEKYNSIQLLTCFKSYLAADNQIMIYGQEANTDEGCVLDDLSPHYQKKDESDEYYKYEYKIARVGEDGIAKSDCPHTYYLKTRELIAHFDKNHKPEKREAEILSVLSNNLNKTSLKGKRTECYPPGEPKRKSKKYEQYKLRDTIIYTSFDWNGFNGNIFLHELNILRPTHLVFLSGPDYRNHVIRDFGEDFYNRIKPMIDKLSVETPAVIGSEYNLSKDDIHNLFDINDYDSGIKILYAYHPSARILNGEPRKKYNAIIEDFIKMESS